MYGKYTLCIQFDKRIFEKCFDACIEVIKRLSDSKQIFEKNKENFVQVKKLILEKPTK